MSDRGVETGGHDHDLWVELLGDGHYDSAKSGEVLGITDWGIEASGPSNVDVVAKTFAGAALSRTARAGEKVALVMPVDGKVQNSGVVVEHLLGAVSMVDVLEMIILKVKKEFQNYETVYSYTLLPNLKLKSS